MEGHLLNKCGVSVGGEGEVLELNSVVLAAQYCAYIFLLRHVFFCHSRKRIKEERPRLSRGRQRSISAGPFSVPALLRGQRPSSSSGTPHSGSRECCWVT